MKVTVKKTEVKKFEKVLTVTLSEIEAKVIIAALDIATEDSINDEFDCMEAGLKCPEGMDMNLSEELSENVFEDS